MYCTNPSANFELERLTEDWATMYLWISLITLGSSLPPLINTSFVKAELFFIEYARQTCANTSEYNSVLAPAIYLYFLNIYGVITPLDSPSLFDKELSHQSWVSMHTPVQEVTIHELGDMHSNWLVGCNSLLLQTKMLQCN